jgi:hypothetical protein
MNRVSKLNNIAAVQQNGMMFFLFFPLFCLFPGSRDSKHPRSARYHVHRRKFAEVPASAASASGFDDVASTGVPVRIMLHVGGTRFETNSQTLLTGEPSMFSSMLSGRFPLVADEDGSFFIDRDPKWFAPILNFIFGTVSGWAICLV